MISDVLFEAIGEIERYQNEMPQCYDGLRDEIENVKAMMRYLQRKLDTPPESPASITMNTIYDNLEAFVHARLNEPWFFLHDLAGP